MGPAAGSAIAVGVVVPLARGAGARGVGSCVRAGNEIVYPRDWRYLIDLRSRSVDVMVWPVL
jgi:hypothetical protein